jgi:type I restriction enzyme S subunit
MREDWTECCFEDLLDYEQPTNYLVESTNYNDSFKTPVLTAGKSFILGYTNESKGIFKNVPTIIFDDFTTASQFVDFEFKVKSSAMKILIPKSKLVNLKFVFYCMQVNKVRCDTHKRYWISVFAKNKLQLPPLTIQSAIVNKIENLFLNIDKGVGDLIIVQDQLKVYRQAVLKKAFEGGFTNLKVNEGELPEGWKWVKIESIIEPGKTALKAGPFGSSLKKEFYVTDGYKIYGQEQVISGNPFLGNYYIDEKKYQELISCKVKPGDILISLVGTVGKVLILPDNIKEGIINPRLIKISLNKSKYDNKFFKYYLESSTVKSIYTINASGTTMDVLNIGIINKIPFPLPPTLVEQFTIVREIESRLSVCDKVEQSITEALEKADALRQSILKKAFEGKLLSEAEIAKCKKEADYEPASKLLEKIKAGR